MLVLVLVLVVVLFTNSSFGFWTCFFLGWGEGGRGMMTPVLRRHPKKCLQKSRFTR